MKVKKLLLVTFLIVAEIVLLSAAVSHILPYRQSAKAAFMRYRRAPTVENQKLWLKEKRAMEYMAQMGRGICYFLGVVNAGLIVWVLVRK
jgi:hypothetical protein